MTTEPASGVCGAGMVTGVLRSVGRSPTITARCLRTFPRSLGAVGERAPVPLLDEPTRDRRPHRQQHPPGSEVRREPVTSEPARACYLDTVDDDVGRQGVSA